MSDVAQSKEQHRFYNGKFAWFPVGIYKKGDTHNSTTLAVRWLFFLIRDVSSINFDLSIDLDFCGLHLRVGVPYINFHLQIRTPLKLEMWAYRNLYRKGADSKFKWLR